MAHFSPDFLAFFKELAANNSKDWFDENRKRYEKSVKKPFADFVQEMINRIAEVEPDMDIAPKDAIMRINRDIRFSKDKTPYKTTVSAIISSTGKKDKTVPGVYLELGPEAIRIYGGAHMLEKDQLHDVRSTIAGDPKAFHALLEDKNFAARFGTIHGEKQKRMPPELKEQAEKEPFLLNKQYYYYAVLDVSLITSDQLADTLIEYVDAARPMKDYLAKALS